MFPRTLGTVLMLVGAIWTVQGLGLADTGSFMDNRPIWAVFGIAAFAAGLILMLWKRRAGKKTG